MTSAPASAPLTLSRFTTSVRALKAAQRVRTEDLCQALHMSRATFFARMNDDAWSLADAIGLSELFGVPVQAMFDGIGVKATQPKVGRKLAAIPGNAVNPTPSRAQLRLVHA